jgi:translin
MINDIKQVENKMQLLEEQREQVLSLSRELIRNAGKAIVAMHAKDKKKAVRLLSEMEKARSALMKNESGFEYNSLQAHQEYVEAKVLESIIFRNKIPSMKELKTDEKAYALGLMDVVGELKREAFDSLLNNNVKAANNYYAFMVEIYDSTLHLRFANAILPEFRRKQDAARIQVENTASEVLRAKEK